jgi:hypothetical protein
LLQIPLSQGNFVTILKRQALAPMLGSWQFTPRAFAFRKRRLNDAEIHPHVLRDSGRHREAWKVGHWFVDR